MSTASKPPLQISATYLGPIARLDGTLSKNAQNMVYARNGTGKSFLTRALRYLDVQAQGGDISKAALDLVADESIDSLGCVDKVSDPQSNGCEKNEAEIA